MKLMIPCSQIVWLGILASLSVNEALYVPSRLSSPQRKGQLYFRNTNENMERSGSGNNRQDLEASSSASASASASDPFYAPTAPTSGSTSRTSTNDYYTTQSSASTSVNKSTSGSSYYNSEPQAFDSTIPSSPSSTSQTSESESSSPLPRNLTKFLQDPSLLQNELEQFQQTTSDVMEEFMESLDTTPVTERYQEFQQEVQRLDQMLHTLDDKRNEMTKTFLQEFSVLTQQDSQVLDQWLHQIENQSVQAKEQLVTNLEQLEKEIPLEFQDDIEQADRVLSTLEALVSGQAKLQLAIATPGASAPPPPPASSSSSSPATTAAASGATTPSSWTEYQTSIESPQPPQPSHIEDVKTGESATPPGTAQRPTRIVKDSYNLDLDEKMNYRSTVPVGGSADGPSSAGETEDIRVNNDADSVKDTELSSSAISKEIEALSFAIDNMDGMNGRNSNNSKDLQSKLRDWLKPRPPSEEPPFEKLLDADQYQYIQLSNYLKSRTRTTIGELEDRMDQIRSYLKNKDWSTAQGMKNYIKNKRTADQNAEEQLKSYLKAKGRSYPPSSSSSPPSSSERQ